MLPESCTAIHCRIRNLVSLFLALSNWGLNKATELSGSTLAHNLRTPSQPSSELASVVDAASKPLLFCVL